MTFKSHITIVHTKLLTEVKYSGNEVKSLRGLKDLHHQNLCLQPICSDTGTRVGMFDFWIRLHPLFDRMDSSRVECMLPKSGSFHEYVFQFPRICKINCRENYFLLTQKRDKISMITYLGCVLFSVGSRDFPEDFYMLSWATMLI